MALQALRGTTDLLPEDVKRWSALERTARRLARLYGFDELRTPLIEDAALFLRSIGETSDIVQKEMFQFEDRGGHQIVLRPEGTASIARAYAQHNLDKTQGFAKLFYLGPMFRAERPQAGRYRQFHQLGAEAIGSASPWVDVDVISLCLAIMSQAGVAEPVLLIASMGCRNDQARSAEALRAKLAPLKEKLCKECQGRFEKNVFRTLDCKHPSDHALVWSAITGSPFLLCADCQAHFDTVRKGLKTAGIAYDDTQVFARGLDYYTRTVFEVRAKGLGAQDAVAAGGRYDHLVEDLGGPSVGAVGFAAGIERMLLAAGAPEAAEPARGGVYLATAQAEVFPETFKLAHELRKRQVPVLIDYDGRSLKAQLREADKAGCRFVAILGEQEVRQRAITLKDLAARTQQAVPLAQFADTLVAQLGPRACAHQDAPKT